MAVPALPYADAEAREAILKRHWSAALTDMGACDEAVHWARQQKSYREAWKKCKRGDWMSWFLGGFRAMKQKRLQAFDAAASTTANISGWADIIRKHFPVPPKLPKRREA